ncbi:hypothetical protein BaRGS_00005877 [Batillaria attramentaria]|uniref:Secreted protein n=1 Tax=Batillaria attramentaria TaxID=370345 RepID=A0ABD0LU60_9CAEN
MFERDTDSVYKIIFCTAVLYTSLASSPNPTSSLPGSCTTLSCRDQRTHSHRYSQAVTGPCKNTFSNVSWIFFGESLKHAARLACLGFVRRGQNFTTYPLLLAKASCHSTLFELQVS